MRLAAKDYGAEGSNDIVYHYKLPSGHVVQMLMKVEDKKGLRITD